MPVVQWQDGLRVGNDIIDADHQVTVDQLNTLVDADASEFPRLYAEFFHHLSVCPEMIFRLRKPFGNKATNSNYFTGRKTSLFSNVFGNLDYNN
jgi:hypothetical protein